MPVLSLDVTLLLSVVFLLSLGLVMVTSASIDISDKQFADPFYYAKRHLIYMVCGIAAAIVVYRIRLVHWEKSGAALAMFALFLLVLVLIPGFGRTVNGATRWLELGVIGLQVAEFARLFLLIYLAGYLVRRGQEVRATVMGFIKPLAVLGAACLLILMQPDFGSAVVLLLTALGVMFLAGVRFWQFTALLCAMTALLSLLALSSPYRLQRLTTFLNPWADPFDTGFQLTQSLIAFGSGSWTGVGLGGSVQKLFYLPEAHNDFLLAILGEELGMFGVWAVLLLFALLAWRGMSIGSAAEKNGYKFGAYLAYGLTLWIAIQAMINTGVSMGLLPTKGLTLPLVSSGGSSLLVMCIAIGLLLRVHLEVTLAQAHALKRSATAGMRGDKSHER
ncbi:MAG TPA: putative lipid II flippase FtsW [Gammaproteobacteria bacterium]